MKNTKATLILLVVGVIISGGVYVYLFTNMQETNKSVAAVQNEMDLELTREARARSAKHILNELAQERAIIDGYFVGRDSVVAFLETIEGLGNISGASVEVNSVNITTLVKENAPDEKLEINFVALGSWKELYHLLSLVEALPYAISLNRVHIERLEGGDNAEPWQGSFIFNAAKIK